MKTYTGTKLVKAKPLSRAAYNEYRGWPTIAAETNDAGYLVEYTDGGAPNDARHSGYISWSPKDVFEAAYIDIGDVVHLQPYQQRVVAELVEVDTRRLKLLTFIASPGFNGVYAAEQDRLREQAAIMMDYSRVLGERINAFDITTRDS
jgi:hypothetical protein